MDRYEFSKLEFYCYSYSTPNCPCPLAKTTTHLGTLPSSSVCDSKHIFFFYSCTTFFQNPFKKKKNTCFTKSNVT